jgi:hypothetical protein
LAGKEVDLATWTHIFALDALSQFVVSKSPNYTEKGDSGGNTAASDRIWSILTILGMFPSYVDLMRSFPKVGGYMVIPASLMLGLGLPKSFPIMGFCMPQIMSRMQALDSTKDLRIDYRAGFSRTDPIAADKGNDGAQDVGREKDLLASLMKLHHHTESKFKASWVPRIALTNFGAGHDTIMITLAGCLYNLATHPQYISRLRADMAIHNVSKGSGYSELIAKVPLLHAVLKESMRLYPAVGFYLPRVVPTEGATVCDTYLPPGTTMGINLWATHRDPNLFHPDPESFLPERWSADGTEEKKKAIGRMDQFWMGFGGQSRNCPGQNMGRFFVLKVIARIVQEFDMETIGEPNFIGWFAVSLKGVGVKFKELHCNKHEDNIENA